MKFYVNIDYVNNQKKYGKMSIKDGNGKIIDKSIAIIIPTRYLNKNKLEFFINRGFDYTEVDKIENKCSLLLDENMSEVFLSKEDKNLFIDENLFVCDSLKKFQSYLNENNINEYNLDISLNKKRFLWFRKTVKEEKSSYINNFIKNSKEKYLKEKSNKILNLRSELSLETYSSDLDELEAITVVLTYTHMHVDLFFRPKNLISWFINSCNKNHSLEEILNNPINLEEDLLNYEMNLIEGNDYSFNLIKNNKTIGNINYKDNQLRFKTITGEYGFIHLDNMKNIEVKMFDKSKETIVDFTLTSDKNIENEVEFSLES
jgi:hypothetical protein